MTSSILIKKTNITQYPADAIVNAANSSLLGGGGVDGAIHRAAGPELLAACRLLDKAKVGQARITEAFGIKSSQYIIHAVGPVYRGVDPTRAAELLVSCYRESLDLTLTRDIRSIAFSAISTGIYGYPLWDATRVAFAAIDAWLTEHPESQLKLITLVAFSDENFATMLAAGNSARLRNARGHVVNSLA